MVFCSLIASSAIRAFISALKLRRCLDFISAPFPRQRFYTLLTGPNFGEHFKRRLFRRSTSVPSALIGRFFIMRFLLPQYSNKQATTCCAGFLLAKSTACLGLNDGF